MSVAWLRLASGHVTIHVSPRGAGPGGGARVSAGHRDEGDRGAGRHQQGVDDPGQTSHTKNIVL